ncbi:MAG: hypothetical protein V1756_00495 [Patescibacteria group bacterium]
MKIKENKNLKYDLWPIGHFEDAGREDPANCIIEGFHFIDEKIELHFRNGRIAQIKAKNFQGDREIDVIVKELEKFIGKSYKDILEADI